jgi:hypothetical protein
VAAYVAQARANAILGVSHQLDKDVRQEISMITAGTGMLRLSSATARSRSTRLAEPSYDRRCMDKERMV